MSIFTGSELEFLAGLNKSWWRLYWKEFSRLRRIEAAASRNAAGTPEFPAETGACADPACVFLRRSAADPANSNAPHRRVELVAGNR
jgi:hypothetical protein